MARKRKMLFGTGKKRGNSGMVKLHL